MRAFLTDVVHAFLALPLYFCLLTAALAIYAWRRRSARLYRRRFALTGLALAVYLVSAPVVGNTLLRAWEGRNPGIDAAGVAARVKVEKAEAAPVILVLTAGWMRTTATGYEAKIGEAGWERLWAAVQLWERIGGTMVFSGAPVADGSDSSAAAMARVAQKMGVPAAAIIVEPRSLNTYENFKFSLPLLPSHRGSVVLITSALYMPRAYAVAQRMALPVIAYPVEYTADARLGWQAWLPANGGPAMLERLAHEWLGMAAYRARGWI